MRSATIEPAVGNQAAECAAVLRASRRHSLPYLPDLHTADEDVQFLRNRVFGVDKIFVALDEDRRVIGFIAFGEGWVNHLYVLPEFHRLGIGGRLLEKARQEWPHLKLWTFERNHIALQFYEKQGFWVVKRTDGTGNEEKEPDLQLQWQRSLFSPASSRSKRPNRRR